MVSLLVAVPLPGKAHGLGNLPIVGVFSSTYRSANITDSSLVVGVRFSVQVNVTNADLFPFNAYEFVLYFDQNYISLYSYDISTGTVFDSPYKSPSTYNNSGALRLAVVNLASPTNNHGLFLGGSGTLANLVFSVLRVGVSPLALAAGMSDPSTSVQPPGGLCPEGCPSGTPNWTRLVDGYDRLTYGVQTIDGYFKNVVGKSGPVASFTISPTSPRQGDKVSFNATASFDADNLGVQYRGILKYLWDFGDSSGDATTTLSVPATTHSFSNGGNIFVGNFSIRLTVVDQDNGFQGMTVVLLTIIPPPTHCVAVQAITPTVDRVKPGTDVPFTVEIQDTGTFRETFNLTITYGYPNATLAVKPNQSIRVNQILHYNYTLPTSHLLAAGYSIFATVQLVGAKNCPQGFGVNQIGIDPPDTATLLLQVVGGVVVVSAIGVAVGFLRRRRSLRSEPL
jgi:hypothetical protein